MINDEEKLDFTEADKEGLAAYIDSEQSSKNDNNNTLDVDTIILFCREDPMGVFDEKIIGALAMMTEADRAKVKTALKGKINSRDFDNAIKDYRKRNGLLRIADKSADRPRLNATLPDCPLDAPVPDHWQINQDGVFEIVTRTGESGFAVVTVEKRFPVPVVLASILQPLDVQDETYSYEVAWLNGEGSWHRVAMDAAAIFDRSRLTGAANFGLPVDSENSKGLLRWLAALRDTREVPSKRVVTRCGWHGGQKKILVVGAQIVNSKEGDDQVNNIEWSPNVRGTEREMVNALTAKGDPNKQKELLLRVCKRWPLAGFLVGASCAAPLLRLLREHNRLDIDGFTVEVVSDQAGVGKSTGIELAASIWGQPSRLVRTCDRTGVAWEVMRYVFSDLPIFLEEVQLAKPEDREKIVYSQSQGMGRERGSRSGGLRTTRRFYNVQLIASEQSLKDSGSREGMEARVITLSPVFGKRSPEHAIEVREIRKQCGTHYGHAGQSYIKYLVDKVNSGRWEDILQLFDELEGILQQKIPADAPGEFQSIAIRMASRVAACGLGLWLLMEALGVSIEDGAQQIPFNAMMATWNREVLKNIDAVPLWKKALAVIQSWAAENRNRIEGLEPFGMHGPKSPTSYIGKVIQPRGAEGKLICFYKNALKEVIVKHLNQDIAGILKAFRREGVIVLDKDKKSTRNVGGGDGRAICFSYETIFPPDDDEESYT